MDPLADRQATISLAKSSSQSYRNSEITNNTSDQTQIYNSMILES